MRFTLDPQKFVDNMLKSLSRKQDTATYGLLDVVKTLTPEDTGLMLDSYDVKTAKIESNAITTQITNSAENDGFHYPSIVDAGAGKIYKYQKPKGNKLRYIGDGVHTFPRAIEAYKDKFLLILKE